MLSDSGVDLRRCVLKSTDDWAWWPFVIAASYHEFMSDLLLQMQVLLTQEMARPPKAKRLAEILREIGPYRWVGIYDVDTNHGLVVNLAWAGPDAPAHPVFPITSGLTSRAIAEKRTVNAGEVANDPNYLTALGDTHSEMIVPVLDEAGQNVLGTIDIESEQPDAFDPATQSCIEKCARALLPFWMKTS